MHVDVCIYACIYLYIRLYVCIYAWIYLCVRIYVYIHKYTYICVYVLTHAWIHLYLRMYAYMHGYTCTCVCMNHGVARTVNINCIHDQSELLRWLNWAAVKRGDRWGPPCLIAENTPRINEDLRGFRTDQGAQLHSDPPVTFAHRTGNNDIWDIYTKFN